MEPMEANVQTQPGKRLNEESKKSGKGPLLIAGIVPGVIIALFQMVYTHFYAVKMDYPSYPKATPREMGKAVTSYIDNALPSYSLDSKALAELNEEADSGVIDDESTYSDPDDDGYNPDDDPDAAVWSH